jgi:hypothetical protein
MLKTRPASLSPHALFDTRLRERSHDTASADWRTLVIGGLLPILAAILSTLMGAAACDTVTAEEREALSGEGEGEGEPAGEGEAEIGEGEGEDEVPAGCERTIESAFIGAGDDIASLAGVGRVTEGLTIGSATLTSLTGLECLTTVEGTLFITGTQITDVDALAALRSVGNLVVQGNAALTDVSGIAGLQGASFVQIDQNPALPTCAVEALQAQLVKNGIAAEAFFIVGNDDAATCDD